MNKTPWLIIIIILFISGCSFGKNKEIQKNLNLPNNQIKKDIIVTIDTNVGEIKIKLFKEKVPKTVENFISLVNQGFYNKVKFHKVIIDFIIQTGDPITKGIHGQDYVYEDEINPNKLPVAGITNQEYTLEKEISDLQFDKKGIVAMIGKNDFINSSQFIITLASTPWLNDKHTIFGEVIDGFEILEKIERGDWINNITINYPILENS